MSEKKEANKKGKGFIKDLTGRRYGKLRVLEPTPRRDKGSVYWRCVCDCGQEIEVTENQLVWGNYQSCGCLKRKNQQEIANQLHWIDGTCLEFLEYRKHRKDNRSGFRGVYREKSGRYRVFIGFKGKRYYVGKYKGFEEAKAARLEAETVIYGGFISSYNQYMKLPPSEREKVGFLFEVTRQNGSFRIQTNFPVETGGNDVQIIC